MDSDEFGRGGRDGGVVGVRATTCLAVFVGGALGSLLRELIAPEPASGDVVTSTLVVNVLACALLGYLHAVRHRLHVQMTHLAAVGFCGGLSTFSSFVAEIARLGETAGLRAALLAPAIEIALGLGAVATGLALGRVLHGAERR